MSKIKNLKELKDLVNRLKEDDKNIANPIIIDTKEAKMADDSYDGQVTIPQLSNQSTIRQTIIDGFEMIKRHKQYHESSVESINNDDYGGFRPAVINNTDGYCTWVDIFINKNMGGKREGLKITWDLPEGKFQLDPWSCKLEKIDAS